MPNYHYKCMHADCANEFQTYQSIHDPSLILCHSCERQSLERVIHSPTICTKGDPVNLGHLADRNRDNMGRYEYQEKNAELAERKQRGRKEISQEAKQMRADWGRPEKTETSLATMKAEQQRKYILTGETPD